jgi:hypothetical protein
VAKRAGFPSYLWAHGYAIHGDVGSVRRIASPRAVQEITGIDKTAVERLLLRGDGELEFATFFNDATAQLHDALSALPTTDRVVLLALGAAVGDPGLGLSAKQANYDWEQNDDGSLQGVAQFMAAAGVPLEWGVMLSSGEDTAASGTSSGTADDFGAQTTQGGRGYLAYREVDSGTPTIEIHDSPDDNIYATLITFTGGTPPLGERGTVTGTVDDFTRWHVTGTYTNADFAVMFQRGTADDIVDLS